MGNSLITWEIGVPLATNRLMLRQYAMVSGLAGFLPLAGMAVVMAVNGDMSAARAMLLAGAVAGPGLFLAMVLISLVVLGNRMMVRYAVDETGVRMQIIDRVGRGAARVALLIGVIEGKPGPAGAGLIAMSDENRSTVWSAVARAIFWPGARAIELRNEWRGIIQIYCTEANYANVAEMVRSHTSSSQPVRRRGNPLPAVLAWSVAVILATLPSFYMPWPFEINGLPPTTLIAFGLATVWLVPLLAWGMIGAIVVIVGQVLVIGVDKGFALLDGSDWIGLAIPAAGLAFLFWLARRALAGRLPSVLARDLEEMAGRE